VVEQDRHRSEPVGQPPDPVGVGVPGGAVDGDRHPGLCGKPEVGVKPAVVGREAVEGGVQLQADVAGLQPPADLRHRRASGHHPDELAQPRGAGDQPVDGLVVPPGDDPGPDAGRRQRGGEGGEAHPVPSGVHGVEMAVDRVPADPQAVVGAAVVVPFAVGPDGAVDDQVAFRVGELGHRLAGIVRLEGDLLDRLPPAVESQMQPEAGPAGQPAAVHDPAAVPGPAEGVQPFRDRGWPLRAPWGTARSAG
jgi:hypothetical protein